MKRSILYLDDEDACLNLFQDMFGADYDVHTTTQLDEARRRLAERSADIVISDQLMPEITGVEFLQEVAAKRPASYRVLLTGGITVGGVLYEVSSGLIHLFVAKPWTEQGMRQMLERSGLSQERREACV